jgi:NADH-quinone oxidoreductase subunit E
LNELAKKYPEEISRILAKYPPEEKRSALMSLLYLAQQETGQVSQEVMQEIARILDVSDTDVASIAGFYTLFHQEQGGRYRIQICNDLPCALRGSEKFLQEICTYLGVKTGQPTEDGLFIVEEVKCLAACHRAPMFQLQGDGEISYHEDQTMDLARQLIEKIRSRAQKEAKA